MLKLNPNIDCVDYFINPSSASHRQYLALKMFFLDNCSAEQVARISGYSVSTIYSMVRDFKTYISNNNEDPFFKDIKAGRKPIDHSEELKDIVINLRKKYLSVPDIQVALNALNKPLPIYSIEKIINEAGFARLPRRDKQFRNEANFAHTSKLDSPKASRLMPGNDDFSSGLAGLLCVLPFIVLYGIDKLIINSDYSQTREINRLSSILSFIALKLSNVKRYSADDSWCMDRGMGLFAGLTVLPKATWFSSYSSGVTREMNISFLKNLQSIWKSHGLLSDTANLDFTTIPYWGDNDHLENNWSGKRGKALASILAVLAQDPESGLLCYGDTTVRHNNESNVVIEFLDFYHSDSHIDNQLKYLVFDSKFTVYQNLNKLDAKGVKFITIRRRSKSLLAHIENVVKWKKIRVQKANGKSRYVYAFDDSLNMKDYDGLVRHVYIKERVNNQAAILITNDFDIPMDGLVRKYARRWLVETDISEHIDFFHLNRNSSGIVIKVDFDLTMTILAHNLYKLFCKELEGYSHCEAQAIFDKFISASGQIFINDDLITVKLKKKRTLPIILEHMKPFNSFIYSWLFDSRICFTADSTT